MRKCPHCGKEISDFAISCPNCKNDIDSQGTGNAIITKEKKVRRVLPQGKVCMLPLLLGVVGYFYFIILYRESMVWDVAEYGVGNFVRHIGRDYPQLISGLLVVIVSLFPVLSDTLVKKNKEGVAYYLWISCLVLALVVSITYVYVLFNNIVLFRLNGSLLLWRWVPVSGYRWSAIGDVLFCLNSISMIFVSLRAIVKSKKLEKTE